MYKFYECENPNCRLRFPGSEDALRWNLCPACRSKTHVVATVNPASAQNQENKSKSLRLLHINALLDNIRSALNVGSIFRTADGAGINKIYTCGITATPTNAKVRKTSLGAETEIQWEKSNNGLETAQGLKKNGYQLWALEDIPGSTPLFQIDTISAMDPSLLIVGNEVTGIDPGILQICDKVISIPMMGKKNSYNVAIAFGIAVSYLLYRLWIKEISSHPVI